MTMKKWAGILGFEGQKTGDGRIIKPGALIWDTEAFPKPFRWASEDHGAHDGAQVIGTLEACSRRKDGAIEGWGYLDMEHPAGIEAERQIRKGMTNGVSLDLDSIAFEVEEGEAFQEGQSSAGQMSIGGARVRAVTLVALPAFELARINLVEEDDSSEFGLMESLEGGKKPEMNDVAEALEELAEVLRDCDDDEVKTLRSGINAAFATEMKFSGGGVRIDTGGRWGATIPGKGYRWINNPMSALKKLSEAMPDMPDYDIPDYVIDSVRGLDDDNHRDGEAAVVQDAVREIVNTHRGYIEGVDSNSDAVEAFDDLEDFTNLDSFAVDEAIREFQQENPGASVLNEGETPLTGTVDNSSDKPSWWTEDLSDVVGEDRAVAVDAIVKDSGVKGDNVDRDHANMLLDAGNSPKQAAEYLAKNPNSRNLKDLKSKLPSVETVDNSSDKPSWWTEDLSDVKGEDRTVAVQEIMKTPGIEGDNVDWDHANMLLDAGNSPKRVAEYLAENPKGRNLKDLKSKLPEDTDQQFPEEDEKFPEVLDVTELSDEQLETYIKNPKSVPKGTHQSDFIKEQWRRKRVAAEEAGFPKGWIKSSENIFNGKDGGANFIVIKNDDGSYSAGTASTYGEYAYYMHPDTFDSPETAVAGAYEANKMLDGMSPDVPDRTVGKNFSRIITKTAGGDINFAAGRTVELGPLDRSPKKNWVEEQGGLPKYISEIAQELEKKGMTVSHAIATAVNTVKRWARGGSAAKGQKGHVSAATVAKAQKALAEWEAKRAAARASRLQGGMSFAIIDVRGSWHHPHTGKYVDKPWDLDLDLKDILSKDERDLLSVEAGDNVDKIHNSLYNLRKNFRRMKESITPELLDESWGHISDLRDSWSLGSMNRERNQEWSPESIDAFEKVDGMIDRAENSLEFIETQFLEDEIGVDTESDINMPDEAPSVYPDMSTEDLREMLRTPGLKAKDAAEIQAELKSRRSQDSKMSLVASGASSMKVPVKPPVAWFSDPRMTGPTPFTITADGQVFGHVALWGVCHTASMGNDCVMVPSSKTNYAMFHLGTLETAEGTEVGVGRITMRTGHASEYASARKALAHYENTGQAVADVVAGEDSFGVWVAGALRPGISDAQLRALRNSPMSGDWRYLASTGSLEMLMVLAVNMPGFPVPRPKGLVASGAIRSLQSAGMVAPAKVSSQKVEAAMAGDTLAADDIRYLKILAQNAREQVADQLRRRVLERTLGSRIQEMAGQLKLEFKTEA